MTELPTIQKDLQKLANTDFSNWNEQDVREDYAKPLLNLLGYEKDTDYDINREGHHILKKPFLMIGRQRIEIDYELVVRKQKFWIIETKAGKDDIRDEAILQAYFYAIHPEVGATYFAVTNGRDFKLFDVREVDEGYRPVLEIKIEDLPNRFNDLRKIIGARELLKHLKTKALGEIDKISSAEILEENHEDFFKDIGKIQSKTRPEVLENRKPVYRKMRDEKEDGWVQILRDLTPQDIIDSTFNAIPLGVMLPQVRTFNEKIVEAENDLERAIILSSLITTLRGRPTSYFRANALQCLISTYIQFPDLKCEPYFNSVGEETKQLIKDCLSHFRNNKLHNKLWILETTIFRTCLKNARLHQTEFYKRVLWKKKNLSEEERAYEKPNIEAEIMEFVMSAGIAIFRKLSYSNMEKIEEAIEELEKLERRLDEELQHIELVEEVKRAGARYWENFNEPWSYLRLVVLDILNPDKIIISLFDEEIVEMIRKCAESRLNFAEDIITKINNERKLSATLESP
jgi:hypothetical protein